MSKKITVRTILVLFLLGTCFLATSPVQHSSLNGNESEGKIPKTSGHWDLTGSLIFIDDNWSLTASSYGWCHYNGTHYIIENVTLDALDSGSGIDIKNSNDLFEIRNCTIFNATSGDWPYRQGAIVLNAVSNGRIVRNHLMNNSQDAIYMWSCNNIRVLHNVIENSTEDGIVSWENTEITISHNNISNVRFGILAGDDENDRIIGNVVHSCNNDAIYVPDSNFTLIQENIVYDAKYGIILSWSHNNSLNKNDVNLIDRIGIMARGSGNNVTFNVIRNGVEPHWASLEVDQGVNNTVIGNTVENNQIGFVLSSCGKCLVYLNRFIDNAEFNAREGGIITFPNKWDNGTIGNYWDDYEGKDVNDDGIGDTLHNFTGNVDNFPIWWDPPSFSITSPVDDQVFQESAPSFSISITEGVPITTWYTLNDGPDNYITSTSGTIDQTAWNALSNGDVFIRFYVSDARDWTTQDVVRVVKNVSEPPTPTDGDEEAIPGYDILFITTTLIASLAIVMILRKGKLQF